MFLMILIMRIISFSYSCYKLLLNNTQDSKLRKAFAHDSWGNITLLKTHLHKIRNSGEFLCRISWLLLKSGTAINKKCTQTISWKCFNAIRINSSECYGLSYWKNIYHLVAKSNDPLHVDYIQIYSSSLIFHQNEPKNL